MRICFLLPALSRSGGVNAVVQHARWLQEDHGFEVTLALLDDVYPVDDYGLGKIFEITLFRDIDPAREPFDNAIATWWETAYWLYDIPSRHYTHFIQSLEDRFYPARTPFRTSARITQGLPMHMLTEAKWIADVLTEVREDEEVFLVTNGIDKEVFAPLDAAPPAHDGPLRILIEGHPDVWFKSIDESRRSVEAMNAAREVVYVVPNPDEFAPQLAHGTAEGPLTGEQLAARYEWADVVLKLSRVEGMFGPPLEAFHKGATCVVWPVTGHDEYIVHGENGVVVDWDDILGTARWLDTLAGDRALLQRLQSNALQTAQAWPSWRDAAVKMADAQRRINLLPDESHGAELRIMSEATRAALGPMDRYAATLGLMQGGWSPAQDKIRELESEIERLGGRPRARAKRFARRVYYRLRPVRPDQSD